VIFVSTGGFPDRSALMTCEEFLSHQIQGIELSGGLFQEDQLSRLAAISKSASLRVHNYFPPPATPFVLNLASADENISERSRRHVRDALPFSREHGGGIYSFHAGFLFDPKIGELGKTPRRQHLTPRARGLNQFIEAINMLDVQARSLGVSLLIENNVLSQRSHERFGCDPFLMTTASECIEVMKATSDNVGLLVDVAHLKVSAASLGFDPVEFLRQCHGWIRAYHLSDNDGTADSNMSISETSWFWPHLRRDLDYYSIEVYGVPAGELKQQVDMAYRMLCAAR